MSKIYQAEGEREFFDLTVTSELGTDFSTYPVTVGWGTKSQPPSTWVTLDDPNDVVDFPSVGTVTVRVRVGSGGHSITTGTNAVWMKIGDAGTTLLRIVRCGIYSLG